MLVRKPQHFLFKQWAFALPPIHNLICVDPQDSQRLNWLRVFCSLPLKPATPLMTDKR